MASRLSTLHADINRAPDYIVRSHGNYLITEHGTRIFDATGGAAVASIGHNDPRVMEAIANQLSSVGYCYAPFFTTRATEDLSRFLIESTNGEMSKAFIVSSGTEAVEAALKMARQYFTELPEPQLDRVNCIARKQSYHGNTLGSLALGYHRNRRAIYEPLLANNFTHVSPCYPYRDMKPGETDEQYTARLAQELDSEFQALGPQTVCAFVAETLSGSSLGCCPAVPGYFKAVKEVCDRYGALLILDEVMSGMGRTGSLHAWEQEGIAPDLQTVAKGLGAGFLPVGALLVSHKVVNVLAKGTGRFSHSQTYQGHPVACASAYKVQSIIKQENLVENVRTNGNYFGKLLRESLAHHKHVGDVRGRGYFWAIEFVKNKETKEPFAVNDRVSARIHEAGLRPEHAISLMPSNGNIDGKLGDLILLSPAYNVTKHELELIVEKTTGVVHAVLGQEKPQMSRTESRTAGGK